MLDTPSHEPSRSFAQLDTMVETHNRLCDTDNTGVANPVTNGIMLPQSDDDAMMAQIRAMAAKHGMKLPPLKPKIIHVAAHPEADNATYLSEDAANDIKASMSNVSVRTSEPFCDVPANTDKLSFVSGAIMIEPDIRRPENLRILGEPVAMTTLRDVLEYYGEQKFKCTEGNDPRGFSLIVHNYQQPGFAAQFEAALEKIRKSLGIKEEIIPTPLR